MDVLYYVFMSIPITNPRQADLAAQYRPKDTTAPLRAFKPSRWYEQTYGQPGNNVQNKAAKAALGSFLGLLDVPVQAIGGMHRDAVAGNMLGEQSPGSRALQNYGQQVGGLWSDVFKPGQGQTPLFQPREFEAAGEAAVDRFGLEGGAALAARGGATALDLLTGLVAGGVGGVGRGAVRAAGDAVSKPYNAYRAMAPENQALYNSIVRGLYHGSRDTGANVAKPFTAVSRDAESWARNWFGGDIFGAIGRKGRQVAEGYTQSGTRLPAGQLPPGLTQRGFPVTRGAKFRLSEPMSDVANRKILDLTQGTLDEVDPALYQRLVNEFDDPDDVLNFADDLAKMDLTRSGPSMGGLHESRYSEAVRPIMEEFGYDTIKHLSGQLQGDIVTPVYAFLNPAGMQARPTLPSLGRVGEVLDTKVSELAQRGAEATGRAGASIREGGASTLDSLAAALSREDMSSLPAFIREFAETRVLPRGAGEGFQDVRQFATNPNVDALLRKLGITGRQAVENTPVLRGAFQ